MLLSFLDFTQIIFKIVQFYLEQFFSSHHFKCFFFRLKTTFLINVNYKHLKYTLVY